MFWGFKTFEIDENFLVWAFAEHMLVLDELLERRQCFNSVLILSSNGQSTSLCTCSKTFTFLGFWAPARYLLVQLEQRWILIVSSRQELFLGIGHALFSHFISLCLFDIVPVVNVSH